MTNMPEEDAPFEEWHETLVRVRYSETDKMCVVYHANYLVWFEIGRTEFCRARGFAYRDMEENENAFLVVAESYCRYKAPAYYDDELLVRTTSPNEAALSSFGYESSPFGRQSDSRRRKGHVVTTAQATSSFRHSTASSRRLPKSHHLRSLQRRARSRRDRAGVKRKPKIQEFIRT